jgi:O-succinylhomoserine sulfhydrylase
LFLETPSNPLTEIADIAALVSIAHARGVLVAVDNCFCTPILQRPLDLGADLVRAFGDQISRRPGAGTRRRRRRAERLTDEVFKFLRTAGPTLSAFNAWVLLKGLETLQIRMKRSRRRRCNWRSGWSSIRGWRVSTIPACLRIRSSTWPRRQQKSGGAIVSFTVKGARPKPGRWWTAVVCCRSPPISAIPRRP